MPLKVSCSFNGFLCLVLPCIFFANYVSYTLQKDISSLKNKQGEQVFLQEKLYPLVIFQLYHLDYRYFSGKH